MTGSALSAGLGWLLIGRKGAAGAAIALTVTHFAIFLAVLGLSAAHAWRRRTAHSPVVEGARA
jgi:O-antigen/teichoic acid export membrane protein